MKLLRKDRMKSGADAIVGAAGKPGSLPQASPLLFAVFLAVIVVLAYQQAWDAGFIWDDDAYVTANELLRDASGLRQIWFELKATPQYYPLVFTSFWLEYHLWGLQPIGYHLVNMLLHAGAAWLFWRGLSRLNVPGAWLAAALFALHPVHVESVAWVTERKNVLSAVFYFSAALAYLRFAPFDGSDPRPRRHWGWYAAAFALFLAALWCKTVTCSLPAALLLVCWWKKGRMSRADVGPLLPFFALGLGLGLLTAWLEKTHVGAAGAEWSLTFLDRCLIAGRALWFYAGKLVWPTNLSFVYPRWDPDPAAWWQWIFPAGAVLVVAGLWFARRRIGRGPLVAVLFFAGTLTPALGFFDVFPFRYSFVADHFQYLASAGLLTLFAAGIVRGVQWIRTRRPVPEPALYGILLFVLGMLTWRQAGIYQNPETLWRATIDRNPNSFMAHNNLGNLLYDSGRVEESIVHYQRALEVKPDSDVAAFNVANAFFALRRLDEALAHYRRALELQPDGPAILGKYGHALFAKGEFDEAIAQYRKALALQPDAAAVALGLGNALLAKGQSDEAIVYLSRAAELSPVSARIHNDLANALVRQGRLKEAIAAYEAALSIESDNVPALSNLAWVLAVSPDPSLRDGRRAVELAAQADQSSGGAAPTVIRTLAAAYAEAGRFPEAQAAAQRALAFPAVQANPGFTEKVRAELQSYEAGSAVYDLSLTNAAAGASPP